MCSQIEREGVKVDTARSLKNVCKFVNEEQREKERDRERERKKRAGAQI